MTIVNDLQPTDVRVVGYIEPPESEELTTHECQLLEGDFRDGYLKGLQIGGAVVWFLPFEWSGLRDFFGREPAAADPDDDS